MMGAAGMRHGFQALTEPADVSYRIDRAHDPAEDVSIAFDDPELAISAAPSHYHDVSARPASPPLAAAAQLLTR